MFVREKIVFPFQGRTGALDIAGRRLRVRIERHFDDRAVALELSVKPGRESIRMPLDLMRAFVELFPSRQHSMVTRSICVHWDGAKDPAYMDCGFLTAWPAAVAGRWANWVQWNTSTPTWVGFEPAIDHEIGSGHIVLHAPWSTVPSSASGAGQVAQNVELQQWSTTDRPDLWPEYVLYAGNERQLILYTMGGLAHGRFKLAKRQLDDFLALEGKAPLHLGFYNPEQGIDVSYPFEWLRLPMPNNAHKAEPYYVIDLAHASRWKDQLSLEL